MFSRRPSEERPRGSAPRRSQCAGHNAVATQRARPSPEGPPRRRSPPARHNIAILARSGSTSRVSGRASRRASARKSSRGPTEGTVGGGPRRGWRCWVLPAFPLRSWPPKRKSDGNGGGERGGTDGDGRCSGGSRQPAYSPAGRASARSSRLARGHVRCHDHHRTSWARP